MQKTNKSAYLSILRILSIYWVVLVQHNFAPFSEGWGWIGQGEFYPPFDKLLPYTRYVTWLTMPICFCVSGFLLGRTGGITRGSFLCFLKNKTLRILMPCMIFGAVFMLIKEKTLGFNVFCGYQHMWFLFYLFIMYLKSATALIR